MVANVSFCETASCDACDEGGTSISTVATRASRRRGPCTNVSPCETRSHGSDRVACGGPTPRATLPRGYRRTQEPRRGLRGHPLRDRRRPGDHHDQPPGAAERLPRDDHHGTRRGLRACRRRRVGRRRCAHRRRRARVLRGRRRGRSHAHRGGEAAPAHDLASRGECHPQQRQAGHRQGSRLLHRRRQRAQRDVRPHALRGVGPVRPGRTEDRLGAAVVGLPAHALRRRREEGAGDPVPRAPVRRTRSRGHGACQQGRPRRSAGCPGG